MTENTKEHEEGGREIAVKVALRFGDGTAAEIRAMATAMSYRSSIVIGVVTDDKALGFDVLGTNIPHDQQSLAEVLEVLALAMKRGQVITREEWDEDAEPDYEDDGPPPRAVDDVVDNVP